MFADVEWYDEHRLGLGERFEVAVRAALEVMVESPESWAVWPGWSKDPLVRSKGVTDFPYRLVCFVHRDLLMVVAVAHEKRRPGYWRERVSSA